MGFIDWFRPEPEVIETEISPDIGTIVRSESDRLIRHHDQAQELHQQLDGGKFAKGLTLLNRDVVAYKELRRDVDMFGHKTVVARCAIPSDATVVQAGGKIRVDELYVAKLYYVSPHARGNLQERHLWTADDLSEAESPYANATYEEGKMHSVVGGVSTNVTEPCDEHGIYVHPRPSDIQA